MCLSLLLYLYLSIEYIYSIYLSLSLYIYIGNSLTYQPPRGAGSLEQRTIVNIKQTLLCQLAGDAESFEHGGQHEQLESILSSDQEL